MATNQHRGASLQTGQSLERMDEAVTSPRGAYPYAWHQLRGGALVVLGPAFVANLLDGVPALWRGVILATSSAVFVFTAPFFSLAWHAVRSYASTRVAAINRRDLGAMRAEAAALPAARARPMVAEIDRVERKQFDRRLRVVEESLIDVVRAPPQRLSAARPRSRSRRKPP